MTLETIIIAKIVAAHGVHGAVRVQTYTDDIEQYKDIFDKLGNKYVMKNARLHKHDIWIVKFNKCNKQ